MTKHAKAQIRAPRAAAAFVSGEQPANQSTSRPVKKSTSKPVDQSTKRRGVIARPGRDLDRITAYLPLELGSKVRVRCTSQRIELSAAIAEALEAWLARGAD